MHEPSKHSILSGRLGSLPQAHNNSIVSRIKIMAELDISEHRHPQDGKIDFSKHGPLPIELRIAIIPTAINLEDVVIRILGGAEPLLQYSSTKSHASCATRGARSRAARGYGVAAAERHHDGTARNSRFSQRARGTELASLGARLGTMFTADGQSQKD
jgi:hypothetical protein